MSCALTIDAVRDRTKTVTRRLAHTWVTLHEGDRLILIEKGQGLPRGHHQTILTEVTVTSVSLEPLDAIDEAEVAREGFPGMTASAFTSFWRKTHGVEPDEGVIVRRIEWTYDDGNTESNHA